MAICFSLAIASAVAAAIGYGMHRAPACFDPPCGGAKDTLIIYGTGGALVFGAVALLAGLAWGTDRMLRRR